MRRFLAAVSLAALFAACAEPATQPDLTVDHLAEPVFAKPGPTYPPNQYGTVTLGTNPAPDRGDPSYDNGECGVSVTIFYGNGGNDLVMQTDNPTSSNQWCGGTPRTLTVATSGGSFTGTRLNVRNMGGVADGSVDAPRLFGVFIGNSTCDRLQWPGGTVTRVGNTFTMNGTTANCLNSRSRIVATYNAPVSFTVVQRATP